jgi:shikimate dehydrogenase
MSDGARSGKMAMITGKSQLVGLLGWPVSHSFSPAMHNAAAAALGLDLVYVPLPVHPDDLATAVAALPALHFLGANVTIPHKETIIPYLDELDPAARAIGAVNTLVVSQKSEVRSQKSEVRSQQASLVVGRWSLVGFNTDWSGFLADLDQLGVAVDGRDCLILGAGGSARAVAYGLDRAGGRVSLVARRPSAAQQLAEQLQISAQIYAWDELAQAVGERPLAEHPPLIINTTPLGMPPYTDQSPWPDGLPFPPDTFVYDLVYNPRQTKLMRQAKSAGRRTANGLGMLVQQGALAFKLWTGVMPDVQLMRKSLPPL